MTWTHAQCTECGEYLEHCLCGGGAEDVRDEPDDDASDEEE